ncbi:hypothetical protein HYU21_04055 [Candidatus Woesearchaeota archaeon]|nr:hypothetical protein [Candidatus Woesearchaeota archaeon]
MNKKIVLGIVLLVVLALALGCQKPAQVGEKATKAAKSSPLTGNVVADTGASAASDSLSDEVAGYEKDLVAGDSIEILPYQKYYGYSGFSPQEVSTKVGQSLTWVNHANKDVEMVFQKNKHPQVITSGKFHPGETYNYAFSEPGTYDYWVVGYGAKGKIVVE